MRILSDLYSAAARRRRERFASRPDLRRRLRRPVISVGNLAVGGRGKTPTVASIARLLLDAGERPAILSRGYARTDPADGVVIVRDRRRIRADLARAGDEPLMLARQLPGACVVVSEDRYLAGHLAERQLGATVHVLDDGFQHLQLERDIEIVIVARADLDAAARTLPSGRLREPADVLAVADALLAYDLDVEALATLNLDVDAVTALDVEVDALAAARNGSGRVAFALRRTLGEPAGAVVDGRVAVAVAGVAAPARVFDDFRAAGWQLTDTFAFRDHHPFDRADVDRICAAAARAGAIVLTTEKDAVRLLPFRPFRVPLAWLPLTIEPTPPAAFRTWLLAELNAARDIITGD